MRASSGAVATPLRVLLVEDSEADAELLLLELRRGGFEVSHERVVDEAGLRRALEHGSWDIVISDYSLPGFDGLSCLRIYREYGKDMPFILMSGTVGEESAVEAMKGGAQDYIMKDKIVRLVPAIQRELREAVSRRERRAFMEHIEFIAYHDPATRLPNQRRFLEQVEAVISARGDRPGKALLLVPEINKFREIRTTLTQSDYDNLVRDIAARIQHCCPGHLAFSRIDEYSFALLMEVDRQADYAAIAARLLRAFEEPYELDPFFLHLDASIGMAVHTLHADSASGLLRNATVAATRARERGQPYALYSVTEDHSSPDNLALLGQLREAIRHGELVLHYQPIIDLRSNRPASVEALVRWRHPGMGLLPPDRFLSLAESSNLIGPLTSWIVDAAFSQWGEWHASGIDIDMGINLSVRNIQDPGFVTHVARRMRELEVEPAHIVFEVTESGIMTDFTAAVSVLDELHGIGFKIAIDDFGTGHSSLAYLQRLPMDDIKVDRNFVSGIDRNPRDKAIVSAVLGFATGLGKRMVAEGVETAETLGTLRSMGCHYAQGFHISKPLQPADTARWLQGHQSGH